MAAGSLIVYFSYKQHKINPQLYILSCGQSDDKGENRRASERRPYDTIEFFCVGAGSSRPFYRFVYSLTHSFIFLAVGLFYLQTALLQTVTKIFIEFLG